MPVAYTFDPTGLLSDNLVTGELHAVNELNHKDRFYIVPKFAPFFIDDFVLLLQESNGWRTLAEGVDFYFTLPFIAGTRSIGKPLYGGIALNINDVSGVVSLSYRTLGGSWVADQNYVLTFLAQRAYNPRVTYWDTVTNVQDTFPPINHTVAYDDIKGQGDVVESLDGIIRAIVDRPNNDLRILIMEQEIQTLKDSNLLLMSRMSVLEDMMNRPMPVPDELLLASC